MKTLTPAMRHKMHILAQKSTNEENLATASEYEQVLYALTRHKRVLKTIESLEKKAQYKRSIVNDFMPWIDGVLAGEKGYYDEVVMTWLVWAFDCDQIPLALKIAAYALKHNLTLPDPFTRSVATLVASEITDKAKISRIVKKRPLKHLHKAYELLKDHDVNDVSLSHLLHEFALAIVDHDPHQALELLKRGYELNNRLGVRTLIARLEKVLEYNEPKPCGAYQ